MNSLAVHASPASAPASWIPRQIVALPIEATSAAFTVARGDSLTVWVNVPAGGSAARLRVDARGAVTVGNPLGWLVADATADDQTTLLTGTDGGAPVVAALDAGGEPVWVQRIAGPAPLQWPVPALLPAPHVVWQTHANEVLVAKVGAQGISAPRRIAVGAALPRIFVARGQCWLAWKDADGTGVRRVAADAGEPEPHWTLPAADAFAFGIDPRGPCVAWTAGRSSAFARLDARSGALHDRVTLDLADATPGTLEIVGADTAVVWSQRLKVLEPEPPRWTNALLIPGEPACDIDGLVHAATGWDDGVALVGGAHILVLRRAAATNPTTS